MLVPVHMLKRFSTFRVSISCILPASTVRTRAANRVGISAVGERGRGDGSSIHVLPRGCRDMEKKDQAGDPRQLFFLGREEDRCS